MCKWNEKWKKVIEKKEEKNNTEKCRNKTNIINNAQNSVSGFQAKILFINNGKNNLYRMKFNEIDNIFFNWKLKKIENDDIF